MRGRGISSVSSNLGELPREVLRYVCLDHFPISHANPENKEIARLVPTAPRPCHISGTRVYEGGNIRAGNKH